MKDISKSLTEAEYKFEDLVDLDQLQVLFSDFSRATGFTAGIMTVPEHKLLIHTGWRDICLDFHRVHPGSREVCLKSNQELTQSLETPGQINFRQCGNGLIDGAAPVFIADVHAADVFTGQVLFQKPDRDFFTRQAEKYGYDLKAYLLALDRVPVVSRESFEAALSFISRLASMIGEMGLTRIRSLQDRKALEKSEVRFRSLVEHLPQKIFIKDRSHRFLFCNSNLARDFGLGSPEEIIGKTDHDFIPDELAQKYRRDDMEVIKTGKIMEFEEKFNVGLLDRWVRTIKVPYRDEQDRITGILGIFEDITDQVRTRQNLEIKEHQLREVVENQTELICRFLPDGTLTFVNEAYCRYFGKTRDELLGRRFTPLIHDQDKNLVYRMFTSLCPEKPQVSYEHRVIMPSGEVRWQHWTDQAFFDSQGKPSEIQAVGRDITEQKLAQEALQESEKRYRALVESQNDLIVRVDPENRLTYVNDTYCRTFGKTREELIGQSFTPLVHEDDIEPTLKAMEGLKKPPYRAQMEQRAMTVSGWRWLHWEDNSILDEKGNIVEIQGVGRDITELKNKQETLQSIFQASQEVSFIITDCNPDGNNTIREFSPGSEIIFGYSREEILGKPIQMLHSSSDQEIFTEILNRLQQNSSWRGQVRLVRKNGREFPALFTVHPFELHGEKATLGVSIDITELEEARQELVQARKKAESANRAKSMFLANMSHEIRTPLNAVLGFAQILQRDAALTAQQKEHVKIISRSGSHLLGIINDILDMSRIEAGRMETKPEDFSLSALLEDITLMFQSRARIKGLELGLEEDSGLPGFIRTDQGMLRQILINLLGNAVKFTDSGRVDIRAFCPGGQDRICISVTDTGPGIDRKELEFLFKPFQQTMEGHRQGGTGLGLSISREYARFLGGDIEVESTPGQGSTFSLALPVQKALSRPERSATKPPCATGIKPGYSPPRVLLVDDSWYNRAYLTALLKPLGFVVQEAQDGHQALEVFKKWHPQVILMNMRMPGLNGCQATKSVRRNENRVKPLIIAITAHATTSTKDEALNCGADYFLSKPFEPHELLEILGRELGLEYEYIRHSEADAPEKPEKAQENRSEEWPGHIIQALRQTLDDGDMADFRKNLKELAGIDPDSASLMQKLAGAYDYQELDRIISRAEEQL